MASDIAANAPHLRRLRLAFQDLTAGLREWHVWYLLAMNDIRARYRRSGLGEFWLTIAMAVNIAAIGFVWAYLFNIPVPQYMPHLALGLVNWTLISTIANEMTMVFIQADGYLRNAKLPLTSFVHRIICRNFIVWGHNIVVGIVVLLIFPPKTISTFPLVIPGLILVAINSVWLGLVLGVLCARFRDLPQIVASVVQIVFYLTPVLWQPQQAPAEAWFLTELNPAANFIAILRDPMLGKVPDLIHYQMVLLITVVGYLVAIPFFARLRGRVVYWL